MKAPFDYANSYLTFHLPDQISRIQLDARCLITDNATGVTEEFVLITPCKSENMFVPEGLFRDPNYDFCAIYSRTEQIIMRTYAAADLSSDFQRYWSLLETYYSGVEMTIRTFENARLLSTYEEMEKATAGTGPLVARCHYDSEDRRQSAVLEYPVKTMSVAPDRRGFQVDTGPLLVPDYASTATRPIERFKLAFTCYNDLNWAEFVFRVPVPVKDRDKTVAHVMHYDEIVRLPVRHELFCGR